ncbi:MAG: glycosyltransferase family 4 protein, partial [Candidatus Eremiobacteraeota bacterium]|nr:glycosyltransferase family 4 protein [Candidatus Eremiobacteraeota bacterium]
LAVDPAAIDVVPLGVDTAREKHVARPDLPFEFPYLLFVGEFEKRKGIDVLIDALARLPLQLRTTHGLVLAGAARGTAQLQSELPTAILGHVSDSVLSALYRNAAAFVYPSRYEGFGLPVLEAMAHGTPVIASDAGAIPETGGDAARYFRSGDAADLAAALTEVLQSIGLAQQMRDRGLQRAAQMPWSATAKKTFEIIRREPDAGSRPRA